MLGILKSGSRTVARSSAVGTVKWQSTSSKNSKAGGRSWRLNRTYIFPILLFSAVSSLAINVRNAKDDSRLLEDQHAAQLSVLRDLINRLTAGENLSQQQLLREYERVGIVKRTEERDGKPSKHISWRETIFGRKKEERDLETERRELADIEHVLNTAAETSNNGDALAPAQSPKAPAEAASAIVTRSVTTERPPTASDDAPKPKPSARVLI